MTAKLVALNLALVAAIAAVAWQTKLRWDDAQVQRIRVNTKIAPVTAPPPAPAPKPEAPVAAKYVDVAQKNLFAKDRNPNVIIEPPAEKPKPMPPLPVLYGVLGLPSGFRALMAEKPGSGAQPVQAGGHVGEFKILSLDAQNVVFEWDGKPVARKVDDLIDRSTLNAGSAGLPGGAVTVNGIAVNQAPPQPGQQQASNALQPQANALGAGKPGAEIGAPGGQSQRACTPGDNTPAGAVVDGYRKTVTPTPFGAQCRWIPAQ